MLRLMCMRRTGDVAVGMAMVISAMSACTGGDAGQRPAANAVPTRASAAAVAEPSRGTLTLQEMDAIKDRIARDANELVAGGIKLVNYGPDASRRLVAVGVSSDVAQARRVLLTRYGPVLYVEPAEPVFVR